MENFQLLLEAGFNLNYSQSTVLIVMSGFMKVKFSLELPERRKCL